MLEFNPNMPVQCPKCGANQKNYAQKQMIVATRLKDGKKKEVWHFACDNCKNKWKMRERESVNITNTT